MAATRSSSGPAPRERPGGAARARKRVAVVAIIVACAVVVAAVIVGVVITRPSNSALPASAAAPSFAVPASNTTTKKVFAHYFPPYPISLDNKSSKSDYYAKNYLSPNGENGKFASVGGLLRDRPIGRAPLSGDWQIKDLKTDVREAAGAGIDGFTVDVLSLSGSNWDTTKQLMDAAAHSGRNFTVVPNLDVTASAGSAEPAMVAEKLAELYKSPAAYQLADGRYVLSSFKAEAKSVAWWSEVIDILNQRYHDRVAFIAVLLDSSDANMHAFAPISYALSDWGARTVQAITRQPDLAATAHSLGVKWMAPVAIQDERPRSELYAEAGNTATLRASWKKAITEKADLVQLVTWNDYSEGTSFAPSKNHGFAFLEISAYYLAAFKAGTPPKITNDSMYITHRIQLYATQPRVGTELMRPTLNCCTPPQNTVEVLTMLTAPGTVMATIGGSVYTANAPAGVSAVSFPLAVGTISATVSRDGSQVLSLSSPYRVVGDPSVQDLQYYAVGTRSR